MKVQNINSVEQLRRISRQLTGLSSVSGMPDYRFAIPDLSEAINDEASQQMNNYKNACGCFMGGLFMGVTAISIISFYLTSNEGFSEIDLTQSAILAAFIIGSVLLGKTIGLLWARIRMIQLSKKIVRLTNSPSSDHFS